MGAFSEFTLNGDLWTITYVDPLSPLLIDRTGNLTVGTTDPNNYAVYLSNKLQGPFLVKVLLHELGHCVMVSYGLIDKIHSVVKKKDWVMAEEWLCNYLMDYGFKIFKTAYKLVGSNAFSYIPKELEKLVA